MVLYCMWIWFVVVGMCWRYVVCAACVWRCADVFVWLWRALQCIGLRWFVIVGVDGMCVDAMCLPIMCFMLFYGCVRWFECVYVGWVCFGCMGRIALGVVWLCMACGGWLYVVWR